LLYILIAGFKCGVKLTLYNICNYGVCTYQEDDLYFTYHSVDTYKQTAKYAMSVEAHTTDIYL